MTQPVTLHELYVRLHDFHGDLEWGSEDRDVVAHVAHSLHDDIEDSGRSRHIQRAIWSAPVTRTLIHEIIDDCFDYDEYLGTPVRGRASRILSELADL